MIDRRSLLAAAAVTALATACAPAAPSASGLRFEHRYGTTEVPGRPQRIVTVGLTEADYPLALGVVPVLVREWFGDRPGALWPWAAARAGGRLPGVLEQSSLNVEQVAAARPDLILGMNSGLTAEEYGRLSAIAPTIAQPPGVADYGARWDDMTRTVGRVLGREAEADRLVADLDVRLAGARARVGAAGRSGLLASSILGSLYLYPTGPAPTFLREMGLVLPAPAVAAFGDPATAPPLPLAAERADLLEADVLLLGLYDGATLDSVLRLPLVGGLRVAREGRIVALEESSTLNGALSFSSVLSLPIVIDELVPRLVAALDGNPTTT